MSSLGALQRQSGAAVAAAAIAGLVTVPLMLVLFRLATPATDVWAHLWATILPSMVRNTALLAVGVGVGTFVVGSGLAWLVTFHRFPGSKIMEWALVLPLAMPAYVLAFVYLATFDFAGPVQMFLRDVFGESLRLPDVRNGIGAVIVMTVVLYPYVYLLARVAFREQAAATFDAARAMGYSRLRAFFHLVLPLARPSIVAGSTLAVLEAMTDFATVRFFNFPTLSEGVVRVWQGMMDREAATEVAGLLLLFVAAIVLLERLWRGQARYYQGGQRRSQVVAVRLRGLRGAVATTCCLIVLALAFLLPVARLVAWTVSEFSQYTTAVTIRTVYGGYLFRSFGLAAVSAVLAVAGAVALAQVGRMRRRSGVRTAVTRVATMGYAVPGAVIAAGVLLTLAAVDRGVHGVFARLFDINPGLWLTGSFVGLIYAYVVRFMAVAYNSVDSSFEKITPSMDMAARSLGASTWRVMWRIHFPLLRVGMAAGAALVFVDVLKELPATLLLMPFGMETLSVWVYMLSAESLWHAAALPALTILAVATIPVVFLTQIGGSDAHSAHEGVPVA